MECKKANNEKNAKIAWIIKCTVSEKCKDCEKKFKQCKN